jgi:MarR family transcriptional regulator, organic hydroperoxide resistance regulator
MAEKKKSSQPGEKKRPKPRPARTAYITLLSTADRVKTFFESVCAPYDITGQQYNVLRILRGAGPEGLPTLMVSERMIERAPGITRMIDRLESKGLVVRETRAGDRRCVHCRITEKGLNLLELMDGPVEQANHDSFRGLTGAELDQFIALLDKTRKAVGSE